MKSWRSRFFRLEGNVLFCYKDAWSEPISITPLVHAWIVASHELTSSRDERPRSASQVREDALAFKVVLGEATLQLQANSIDERDRWLRALRYSQVYTATRGAGPFAEEIRPDVTLTLGCPALLSVRLVEVAAGGQEPAAWDIVLEAADALHVVRCTDETEAENAVMRLSARAEAQPLASAPAAAPAPDKAAGMLPVALPLAGEGLAGSAGEAAGGDCFCEDGGGSSDADEVSSSASAAACATCDEDDLAALGGTGFATGLFSDSSDDAELSASRPLSRRPTLSQDPAPAVLEPTLDDALLCCARALLDVRAALEPSVSLALRAAVRQMLRLQLETTERSATDGIDALRQVERDLASDVSAQPDVERAALGVLIEHQVSWAYVMRKARTLVGLVDRCCACSSYRRGLLEASLQLSGVAATLRVLVRLRFAPAPLGLVARMPCASAHAQAFLRVFGGANALAVTERLDGLVCELCALCIDRLAPASPVRPALRGPDACAAELHELVACLELLEPPALPDWHANEARELPTHLAAWWRRCVVAPASAPPARDAGSSPAADCSAET